MRYELNVVGLDCAHCALTLEKYLAKIGGVEYCNINFSTSKLYIDVQEDNYPQVYKQIIKTAKEVNPSVKISKDNASGSTLKIYDIILYVIGIMLGFVIIFVNMSSIWHYVLLTISALCMGYRTYWKAVVQLSNLKINENTLITLSLIGAIGIGESVEGLMVIALYTLGKFLESKAVNYSRKSISKLISNQPEYAVVIRGDKEEVLKPESVNVGDIIIVRAGEKIPLDGEVVEGSCSIDKSHLTGESVPVCIERGMKIESGSIVLDSSIQIRVTALYSDCAVSKILNMVSNASNNKSKTESIISKISSYYTLGVIISSIIVFAVVWGVLGNIEEAVYRGLIFLVVSCPCAFAISVPLTYFSGIGRSSKEGILIKGSNYIDASATIDTLVFDKTGTITTGKFVVDKVKCKKGIKQQELLSIVVAGEVKSNHPIALAIREYCGDNKVVTIKKFKELPGEGIKYEIDGKKYYVGRTKGKFGSTIVSVKRDDVVIGQIYLKDSIKREAYDVFRDIKGLNIQTMMLSGDNVGVSQKVAKEVGIDDYKGGLLPQDKYKEIEMLKNSGHKVGFVGDGLNDAPALTLSDVGISMGIMGSDATIGASDVVIADDKLTKIPKLIKISRKTRNIALGNIVFSAIIKLSFLVLGALGLAGMLLAVFADVGVTLLAILNSLRVLYFKIK